MLALIVAVAFAFQTIVAQAFPPAFPPVTPTPLPTAAPTRKPAAPQAAPIAKPATPVSAPIAKPAPPAAVPITKPVAPAVAPVVKPAAAQAAPIAKPAAPVVAPDPVTQPAPAGTLVLVPGGTSIIVSLAEPLSSGAAKQNDQVGIVVKKEVDVNGFVVVAAGATGHATITTAVGARGNGSGGKLSLAIDWVYGVDGEKIMVSSTDHSSATGDNKGAASTATLLSWAFLGPIGFFAHNFVRGHDVTIGTEKTFTVFIDHDAHVTSTQKASDAGVAH